MIRKLLLGDSTNVNETFHHETASIVDKKKNLEYDTFKGKLGLSISLHNDGVLDTYSCLQDKLGIEMTDKQQTVLEQVDKRKTKRRNERLGAEIKPRKRRKIDAKKHGDGQFWDK